MSLKHLVLAAAIVSILALASCRHEEPNFIYMPDMVYSPAMKAQKEGAMRMPVEGTVSRDFVRYPYPNDPDGASKMQNPLRPTMAVLERGKAVYNTYCIVCHGTNADGDGPVAGKFPRPPTLHSDKVRGWTDGRIYHVIMMGQNNIMPSYAAQIAPGDRWAIIYYIRALQRSKHPSEQDLKAAQQEESE
jgi:hypothetical protein